MAENIQLDVRPTQPCEARQDPVTAVRLNAFGLAARLLIVL